MTVTMSMSPDFDYDYDDGYGGNSIGPCEWIHTQCTKPYIAYGLIGLLGKLFHVIFQRICL